jgi:hypothetical protein
VRTDWAPLGGAEGNVAEAVRLGMAVTIFHWGAHAWAIYAVVGLALALFSYNKGLPLTLRSCFYPIFGERVWGWPGHIIDILAIFSTIFGLATSLGIGAQQSAAGLNFLFGLPTSNPMMITLIVLITAVALVSVVAGLDAGVKRLSEINMVLAAALLIFVIAFGPTMEIASGFFENLVAYGEYLPALSMPFLREDVNFVSGWTAFYWAWWISWSPFVRLTGNRHDRSGRQGEHAAAAASVLGDLGGAGGDCAAAGRWAGRGAGHVAVHSLAIHDRPAGRVLRRCPRPDERAALKIHRCGLSLPDVANKPHRQSVTRVTAWTVGLAHKPFQCGLCQTNPA